MWLIYITQKDKPDPTFQKNLIRIQFFKQFRSGSDFSKILIQIRKETGSGTLGYEELKRFEFSTESCLNITPTLCLEFPNFFYRKKFKF